jgi:hypothetical protein
LANPPRPQQRISISWQIDESIAARRARRAQVTHIADWDKTHSEGEDQLSSRPGDHLQQLEGEEAWRELRERQQDEPGYYEPCGVPVCAAEQHEETPWKT